MNKRIEVVYQICRLLAVTALIFVFEVASFRLGSIVTLLYTLFWLISRRFLPGWLSSARLVGFVFISVLGLINGVTPVGVIAGVTFALVCWELEDRYEKPAAPTSISQFETLYLKWLGIAALSGLMIGEACVFLKFYLPFEAMLLAGLLVLFSVYQIFAIFRKAGSDPGSITKE